ncbi:hypothetical protein BT96DRAFT_485583 [Gymnopus androsaceus JB14]|uniref:Uncharacterized protein n=1 Tax=Gymnopus androsaceus JB14 TaxID=1447944 RepID=A0A6A4I254_9AGAR|nr:hypothetical protein BT96DRAFT_485583 [Gymnopus androsaceus JB14]
MVRFQLRLTWTCCSLSTPPRSLCKYVNLWYLFSALSSNLYRNLHLSYVGKIDICGQNGEYFFFRFHRHYEHQAFGMPKSSLLPSFQNSWTSDSIATVRPKVGPPKTSQVATGCCLS